jgi:hypothetical protein
MLCTLNSTAEALNKPAPAPPVIEAEIKALSEWMTDIKSRQGKVKITEIVTTED